MSGWDNTTDEMISTGFGPPNEVTVLFEDKTVTFPFSTALTLANLAQQLAEEAWLQSRQMISVTVKLGGAIAVNPVSAAGIRKSRPRPLQIREHQRRQAFPSLVMTDIPPPAS